MRRIQKAEIIGKNSLNYRYQAIESLLISIDLLC